jgi:F-type H+-transporting ATPase subunit delta
MKRITISDKNYANALVQIGHKDAAKNIEIIQKILAGSPELTEVLVNPAVSEGVKYSLIEEVFSKAVSKKMVGFLKVLVNKKRFGEFDTIVAAFEKELDEINNIKRVEVVSAVKLDDKIKKKIADKLNKKLQKNIEAQWSVDDGIIAGLVVKIEDDVIDTSVRTKIENLRKNII